MKTYLMTLILISMPLLHLFAGQAVTTEQLSGEWLNRCAIKWAKDIRAGVTGGNACSSLEVLHIFREGNIYLREAAGLTEGGSQIPILEVRLLKDDSYIWTLGAGNDGESRPTELIRVVSRTKAGIREIEWEKHRFIKTGPYTGNMGGISRYLNKLILGGKYKDQKGRVVTFTDDEFIYPDNEVNRSLKYKAEPVVPFDGDEYPPGRYSFRIVDATGNTAYGANGLPIRMGFEWRLGKLYLYYMNWTPPSGLEIMGLKVSDEKIVHSTDPFFILTPVKTGR